MKGRQAGPCAISQQVAFELARHTHRCVAHIRCCAERHLLTCRNLLPGTLEYNDKVLAIKRVLPQSEAEVLAAIEQASPAWQAAGKVWLRLLAACSLQSAV